MPQQAPHATILVVDDNRGNRHFASVLLKPEGIAVLQADSLVKALDLLERESVDLVLADVRMPGGGGFELYASLRGGKNADVPFLLMSATLDPGIRERAAQLGPGLQVSERPLEADEYIAAIKTALAAGK